jgi:hypothetical protein
LTGFEEYVVQVELHETIEGDFNQCDGLEASAEIVRSTEFTAHKAASVKMNGDGDRV